MVTLIVVLLALLPALVAPVAIWLPGDIPTSIYADDIDVHRFHSISISAASWILFASVASQLRKPGDKTATMVLALAAMVWFIPFDLISGIFTPVEILVLGPLVVMFWLHPGRHNLQWRPLHKPMLLVVAIGAIPGVIYAWGQLEAQLNGPPSSRHVELGHYGATAAMTLIILTAAAVGATSLAGRRLATTLAASAAAMVGVFSLMLSTDVSSPGVVGGVAVVAWSVALIPSSRAKTAEAEPETLPSRQPTQGTSKRQGMAGR